MNVRAIRKRAYPKGNGGPNIGLRCKSYAEGCVVCESWKFKDESGRFPYNYEELRDYMKQKGVRSSSAAPG